MLRHLPQSHKWPHFPASASIASCYQRIFVSKRGHQFYTHCCHFSLSYWGILFWSLLHGLCISFDASAQLLPFVLNETLRPWSNPWNWVSFDLDVRYSLPTNQRSVATLHHWCVLWVRFFVSTFLFLSFSFSFVLSLLLDPIYLQWSLGCYIYVCVCMHMRTYVCMNVYVSICACVCLSPKTFVQTIYVYMCSQFDDPPI